MWEERLKKRWQIKLPVLRTIIVLMEPYLVDKPSHLTLEVIYWQTYPKHGVYDLHS